MVVTSPCVGPTAAVVVDGGEVAVTGGFLCVSVTGWVV